MACAARGTPGPEETSGRTREARARSGFGVLGSVLSREPPAQGGRSPLALRAAVRRREGAAVSSAPSNWRAPGTVARGGRARGDIDGHRGQSPPTCRRRASWRSRTGLGGDNWPGTVPYALAPEASQDGVHALPAPPRHPMARACGGTRSAIGMVLADSAAEGVDSSTYALARPRAPHWKRGRDACLARGVPPSAGARVLKHAPVPAEWCSRTVRPRGPTVRRTPPHVREHPTRDLRHAACSARSVPQNGKNRGINATERPK